METLSIGQARRIALTAQGFNDPLPKTGVDARHLRRVLGRVQLLQIDSVNIFARAHLMPAYSRLGPWPVPLLDDLAFGRRELFEYWGHVASYLPVAQHPLMRWRMAEAEQGIADWGFDVRPDFTRGLLERLRNEGPSGAGALREAPRNKGSWWDWDEVKRGLEYLFFSGQVTTAYRTNGFERVYDLSERVIPASILALPTPTPEDAQRTLLALGAKAHGVATLKDLRDYFRLKPEAGRVALASLVEAGELLPVQVEGWRDQAYLHRDAVLPRWVRRSALLSPFDPLVWERARTQRLWGIDYRIEIYTPAPKRVYGYYCLLYLQDEAIRARVDLKADRKDGVLRVQAAWLEPEALPAATALGLAAELGHAAGWLGLSAVVVEDRGDLARELQSALSTSLQV